jgi:hypothetical protein
MYLHVYIYIYIQVDALEREVEGLRTAAAGIEQEHQVLLSLLALLVQSTCFTGTKVQRW